MPGPAHPSVSVTLLASTPQLIDEVARIRWAEWGHPPEPEDLSWWMAVTRQESGSEHLPVTFVATTADGQVAGAVGMGEFDIAERRDRSPWILA